MGQLTAALRMGGGSVAEAPGRQAPSELDIRIVQPSAKRSAAAGLRVGRSLGGPLVPPEKRSSLLCVPRFTHSGREQ